MSVRKRLLALAGVAMSVVLIGTGVSPAAAVTSAPFSGTASSTFNWSSSGADYWNDDPGDDFGFDNTSGIAIDGRWANCLLTKNGATHYDIYGSGQGRVTLGTGFLTLSCLKLQFRGYSTTGNFSGTVYFNQSWA